MVAVDDELADATDALLSGRDMDVLSGENAELQNVVVQLYEAIDPKNSPSIAFQQRLVARLTAEWNRQYAPRLRLLDQPAARVLALAAAVVLVLGAVLVLAVPDTPAQLHGAAIGFDDLAAIVVLIAVAAAGGFVYWRSHH